MPKFATQICLLFSLALVCGCAPLFIGAAVGTGVYTYVAGELTRTYNQTFDQTREATFHSLGYLKIAIDENTSDDGKISIKAHQTDGSPVVVKITETIDGKSEVAVRCGRIGFWNRKNAELIHATILNSL